MTKDELTELKGVLEPFAKVATLFADRIPQHGDVIQGWEFTSGTAELRISQCQRAAEALAKIDAAIKAAS
jgi:hypothetical protein